MDSVSLWIHVTNLFYCPFGGKKVKQKRRRIEISDKF